MGSHTFVFLRSFFAFMVVFATLGHAGQNVHDFVGVCESCHLSHPEIGVPGIYVDEVDALCRGCHMIARNLSHPSGIIPSIEVDPAFPLSMEGRMVCTSCHNLCQEQDEENPHLLRLEFNGVSFCLRCHEANEVTEGRHVMAAGFVHAKPWTPPKDSLSGRLDEITIGCISCHGGNTQAPTAKVTSYQPRTSLDVLHGSHPVGMDYAKLSATNSRLRSFDDLAPVISLYEGKVGCVSCHSPYSAEEHHLVIENSRSQLCRECHKL